MKDIRRILQEADGEQAPPVALLERITRDVLSMSLHEDAQLRSLLASADGEAIPSPALQDRIQQSLGSARASQRAWRVRVAIATGVAAAAIAGAFLLPRLGSERIVTTKHLEAIPTTVTPAPIVVPTTVTFPPYVIRVRVTPHPTQTAPTGGAAANPQSASPTATHSASPTPTSSTKPAPPQPIPASGTEPIARTQRMTVTPSPSPTTITLTPTPRATTLEVLRVTSKTVPRRSPNQLVIALLAILLVAASLKLLNQKHHC